MHKFILQHSFHNASLCVKNIKQHINLYLFLAPRHWTFSTHRLLWRLISSLAALEITCSITVAQAVIINADIFQRIQRLSHRHANYSMHGCLNSYVHLIASSCRDKAKGLLSYKYYKMKYFNLKTFQLGNILSKSHV